MRPRRAAAAALLCMVASGLYGCARPFPPPGGERDVAYPRLVSTTPEPLAVVAPGNERVVFRFDERISERGFSEALVLVSPLDSTVRVDRSGAEVRVSMDGGWLPNRVYRVVLLPGMRDLFGNERREPVELVFSTGMPVGNTALAGIVMDRVTGTPAVQGVVDAVHRTEGARYTAIADSSGFYSLRYLPLGEYDVRAYDDLNRNRRRDTMEPLDSGYSAVFTAPTDTVARVFDVLVPDSSAPRVVSARALDSLHVHVQVDDYFDPGAGLESVVAEVLAQADSGRYAAGVAIIPQPVFQAEQQALRREAEAEAARIAADSAAAVRDTAAVRDSAAVRDTAAARDTAVVREAAVRPAAPALTPEDAATSTLPIREFVVRLDRPLPPGEYLINVGGLVNLHGLVGGGLTPFGVSAPAPAEPPPPAATPPPSSPPPAPPDTTSAGRGA